MPLSEYERRAIGELEAAFETASQVRRRRRRSRLALVTLSLAAVAVAATVLALAAAHVLPGAAAGAAGIALGMLVGMHAVRIRQRWLLGAYSAPGPAVARGAIR